MKIGILTYHRAINYGAFLQAYGLCQRLNEEPDIDAEIIDFHMEYEYKFYSHRKERTFDVLRRAKWIMQHFSQYKFEKRMQKSFADARAMEPLSDEYLMSDNIEEFQRLVKGKYDFLIVGSDEVWKVNGYRGFPTPYWLPGDLDCGKLSYAASSRDDFSKLDERTKNQIRNYLNDFLYISVRDELTKFNLSNYINPTTKIEVYSDPSFIYDYKPDGLHGRKILADRLNIDTDKKIAIVVIGRKNTKAAEQIRKELAKDYQLIAVQEDHFGYMNFSNLTPFEWVDVIAGADLVCASFFHPTCFSIICQTPFLAFNLDNKLSKLSEVLEETGNIDRLIMENDEMYQEGFLSSKARELSGKCNGQDYVMNSRKKFAGYIKLLHELYENKIRNV